MRAGPRGRGPIEVAAGGILDLAPSSPLSSAARTVGESSDCPSDSEARLKLLLAAYWTWHLAPPLALLLGQWANNPTVRATPKPD